MESFQPSPGLKIIYWCSQCTDTHMDTLSCPICKGKLEEIGWVEKNG